MTIKQLYPTQRPALDLNFAQQERLDSRVTFTRASTGTYVDSDGLIKTAADNEARFDHDPATGESLGLLVEEARTNLITRSIATGATNGVIGSGGGLPSGWVIDQIQPGTSVEVIRSGTEKGLTYVDIRFSGTSGSINRTLIRPGITVSMNGETYYLTAYSKLVSGTKNNLPYTNFDNGALSLTSELKRNTGATRSGFTGTFFPRFDIGAGSPDQSYDITIRFAAPQMELGAFPTSYIPTSGSTVTRSADVASLTNSSIYNTDSFTILNEPFGSAAGSSTLSLVGGGDTPIKRTAVYNQDLTQTQINASVGKTDEFWRWRILGSSFGLPDFFTDGQVTVDWGDGTVETLTTSDHTFTDGGGYHDIGFRLDSGTYFRPYIFDNASHDTKVVAVGPAPESMVLLGDRAFMGCTNLEAFDATVNANGGDSLNLGWYNCTGLTSFPLIDTSSVTSFNQVWLNCSSLTSFPLIDTSSGTNFNSAWQNCSSLTSFPLIDTSSGTIFNNTWYTNAGLTSFPLIDTSSGTSFVFTWYNCTSLTSFPLIDTSSGINFGGAWRRCLSLTSFPLIDTSSGTSFSEAWRDCSSLTSFPLINTSSGTNFSNTWYGCNSLTSFPLIDTSSGTDFSSAWNYCSGLTSFPLIDTSSGTNFSSAWNANFDLTSFPLIDTSSGTNFFNTWNGCTSLTSFPLLDTSSGTTFYYAWTNCTSLTSFPANFFDSWTGTPADNCFVNAWDGCSSLTATSVENILNSIDTSGQSAPAAGVDITIDYNTGTGTPNISTAVTNLKSRGWTITLNGVVQ